MSNLSQWAENDDADEDDNIIWDESTDQKLAENRGGFHLRKQSKEAAPRTIPVCKTPTSTGPRLISTATPTIGAPPTPTTLSTQMKKKDTRKATKFGLGERVGSPALSSPSSQKMKIEFRTNGVVNTKRRITKTKTTSGVEIGVGSTTSTGSIVNSASLKSCENPEQIRRFLLAEVKQMSIERLVADAKRYMYLEDFHEKTTNATSTTTQPPSNLTMK